MITSAVERPDSGVGLISSTSGLGALLLLLLLAVQVSLHLAADATVSAAGWDAARSVASREVDHRDPVALARALDVGEDRFTAIAGPLARDATVDWEIDATTVRFHVEVRTPSALPRRMATGLGLATVQRTFTVRIEEMQIGPTQTRPTR